MLIILEGPDGAGKSTYAKQMQQEYTKRGISASIVHMSYPKTDDERVSMIAAYIEIIERAKTEVILLDRCWYSELVYGPIIRGKAQLTARDSMTLSMLSLQIPQVHIVYFKGNRDLLWSRCTERGESYVTTRQQFDKICERYDALFSSFNREHVLGIPVQVFIVSDEDLPNEILP